MDDSEKSLQGKEKQTVLKYFLFILSCSHLFNRVESDKGKSNVLRLLSHNREEPKRADK